MSNVYSSPIRKLIPFFEKSRDQWKEKCKLAKREIKILKNHLTYLKKRKQELKAEVAALKHELEETKKNCTIKVVPVKTKK